MNLMVVFFFKMNEMNKFQQAQGILTLLFVEVNSQEFLWERLQRSQA
jgi:hypothetical protein